MRGSGFAKITYGAVKITHRAVKITHRAEEVDIRKFINHTLKSFPGGGGGG